MFNRGYKRWVSIGNKLNDRVAPIFPFGMGCMHLDFSEQQKQFLLVSNEANLEKLDNIKSGSKIFSYEKKTNRDLYLTIMETCSFLVLVISLNHVQQY